MSPKHSRVCAPCGRVRWAPCSATCAVPPDHVKGSWLELTKHDCGCATYRDGLGRHSYALVCAAHWETYIEVIGQETA